MDRLADAKSINLKARAMQAGPKVEAADRVKNQISIQSFNAARMPYPLFK